MTYKALIFDFDYTLGDATEAILAGFTHAMTTMGYPAPEREAVRRTVGMQVQDAYTLLTGDPDPANRARFYELFHPVARDLQGQGKVDLFPGAVELLRALRDHGITAAVVSTKNTPTLETIFRVKGVDHLFAHVVGGDKVSRPKPDPEGVNWVLAQMGLTAKEVLYCGDTTIDAETAQNAGCDFCAVLNGTTPAEDFDPYLHKHIAPDLKNLQAWLGL